MPQIEITIGGRTYEVACQDGEEDFLQIAANRLDAEATHLAEQIGRVPEARMLLMAGLMIADKQTGIEDRLRGHEAQIAALQDQLARLQRAPQQAVPQTVTDAMADMAERAEALADLMDQQSES